MADRRDRPAVAPARAPVVALYEERLADRQRAVGVLDQRHARLAWVRVAIFGAGVVLAMWQGRASVPWMVAPGLAFGVVAYVHARVLNARDRAARAVDFYQRGLARLEDRWHGTGGTGERFREEGHPCADDIDLFGPGSLFQLLSTPRTRTGEATLAGWLLSPAGASEVVARQEAVAELRPLLDFREALFVIGPEVRDAVDTDALRAWALTPTRFTATWPLVVLPLLVVAAVSAFGVWIWTGEPPAWLLPALAAEFVAAAWFHRAVTAVIAGAHRRVHELELLSLLLDLFEKQPVTSPRLRALAALLNETGRPPSSEVARLARLVDLLTSRQNQLFAPLAALLMVATQSAIGVDRWRARCGAAVPRWVDAVGEYEALASLAGYAGENPGDPFPEVVEGEPLFEADDLAHPLLPPTRAVANSVRLGGPGPRVMLVSGSNMSGKSTLLRTVGITAALAQAGGPVRARRVRLSPLRVGATLRIQDSLQTGQSRFFAEISRISAVVSMAKAHRAQPETAGVLFLLDEVLAGTNSHDRRQGAEAIIRGLVELGAIGLVTTHDLALTSGVSELGLKARNVHFEDRFEGGVLHFDYRLREGVVQASNALALMRSIGLDV